MSVVEVFQQFDLIKFDQQTKLHLVKVTLTFKQLLVLHLYELHLCCKLHLQLLVVLLLKSEVRLQQLNLLPVLLQGRHDAHRVDVVNVGLARVADGRVRQDLARIGRRDRVVRLLAHVVDERVRLAKLVLGVHGYVAGPRSRRRRACSWRVAALAEIQIIVIAKVTF